MVGALAAPGAITSGHGPVSFGAAAAGVLLLLMATALCMWWRRQRKSAPEEVADKEQLRKDLLHAHDSVVVAKKRITGDDVKGAASIPAVYDSSECGSEHCGNSSGGAAGASRVPMVGFLDLPEEEQKRLRAGNINDSVLIMRNKRATSGNGAARSPSGAKGVDAAVAYYKQRSEQIRNSSDGGSAEEPGQLRGRSSDGSQSGKRVQFGAAQVLLVTSVAGDASAAGAVAPVAEAGEAAATVMRGLPAGLAEHAGVGGEVMLPGGVNGDSISIDTSELGAGQRHSRGDDTARIAGAPLPGAAC